MQPATYLDSRAAWASPAVNSHDGTLRANLSRKEIPSLYGLRGIAALAVVVYHYLLFTRFAGLVPGPLAVYLFFELSGLLITWLLLKELEGTGRVSWKRFYLRRALRLFPVFYVVWGLCRLAGPFAGSAAAFFYMGDYYTAFTGHYSVLTSAWSLGVEEKFYLLWPLVLVRLKRKSRVKALFAVLLLQPVYRSVLILAGFRVYTEFAFDTRLDAIVLGCLLAVLLREGWEPPQWFFHPATRWIALALIFILQQQTDIVTYLLAIILLSVVGRPPAFLNHGLTKFLGRISYSLYLCHEYTSTVLWPRLFPHASHGFSAGLLAGQLALAIAVASALYFGVERPFLRVKDLLVRVNSSYR